MHLKNLKTAHFQAVIDHSLCSAQQLETAYLEMGPLGLWDQWSEQKVYENVIFWHFLV